MGLRLGISDSVIKTIGCPDSCGLLKSSVYYGSFLFLFFFGLWSNDVLSAQSASAQMEEAVPIMVQNAELFEGVLQAERLSISGLRGSLPDHFFAISVLNQWSKDIQKVAIGDRAAVFVVFEAETDSDLMAMVDPRYLEEGEILFFYSKDDNRYLSWSEKAEMQLSQGRSGKVVLEWNGSVDRMEELDFSVLLRNLYLEFNSGRSGETGFGKSWDCHININCPEGENFNEVKDGVVRIMVVVEEGVGFCSGALVNNTAEDHTPYVLTAFHCMDGYTPIFDQWRFDFFYEGNVCPDPSEEPEFRSLIGSEYRAGHFESDFMLLEITESIPPDFTVPFLGWDRREDYKPANTAILQHPAADIKKVALYSNLIQVHNNNIFWDNGVTTPPQSHYRQNLTSGTFQPGSSGGPLVSPEGRIMGQLHGGNPSCHHFIAYSGILFYSWDLGDGPHERLRDWLDPLNTGQEILDHSLVMADIKKVVIEGQVLDPIDRPVGLVEVVLECGHSTESVVTDADGVFEFEIEFIEEESCTISFSKDINPKNGVNVLDIALIRRHILGIELLTGWQLEAADVAGAGNINVLDIADIRRLIVEIYDRFPKTESWKINPESIDLEFHESGQHPFEIQAIKMGDVDFSSDPGY